METSNVLNLLKTMRSVNEDEEQDESRVVEISDEPTVKQAVSIFPEQEGFQYEVDVRYQKVELRIAHTLRLMMSVYSIRKKVEKADRFRQLADKYYREGLAEYVEVLEDEPIIHIEYARFIQQVGDDFIKNEKDNKYEISSTSFKDAYYILSELVPEDSYQLIIVKSDIGDVYFEQRERAKALQIYLDVKKKIQ